MRIGTGAARGAFAFADGATTHNPAATANMSVLLNRFRLSVTTVVDRIHVS